MKSYGLPMEVLETQLQEFGRMPRQRRGDPMLWEISPHLWEGLEHLDDFSILYGMSSFPLTNMFQDGYCTTNQLATSGLKTASFLHVAMENPQRMMAF